MCNLKNLARVCGSPSTPGTQQIRYWAPVSEFAAWPATRAAGGGSASGDTKILDEAFDFTGAGVGKGFWRKLSAILPDTGNVSNNLEGQIGGQGYRQRDQFFVEGNGPDVKEWLDDLLACSGCIIWMVPTKTSEYEVLGDLNNPVYLEAVEGGSGGETVGYTVTVYANTGKTTYHYDADTHGIDETPEEA